MRSCSKQRHITYSNSYEDVDMEKCDKCGQLNGIHKMGCETRWIANDDEQSKIETNKKPDSN